MVNLKKIKIRQKTKSNISELKQNKYIIIVSLALLSLLHGVDTHFRDTFFTSPIQPSTTSLWAQFHCGLNS